MEVDAIYHEIDGWGRYQKLMYFMLCLPSIVAGAAVVSLSWTAYDMPYRCLVSGCENATSATYNAPFLNFTTPRQSDPANADYPWSECDTFQHSPPDLCEASAFDSSHQTTCSQYVYDKSVMHSTVVSEFQLSCGRDWLPTLANSLYMVGMFVGSLVIGHISDRFGRKTAMLLSFLVLGVASTATVFVKSFGVFAPLRFLTGVGGMGTFMTTFLLAVETVSNDVRTFCGFAIHFFFPLGESIVGVLAMYIKDWRDLQLFIALPVFIFLSYWLFVPESARWLAAEGRFKEAEAVLRTAAKYNGTEFPEHLVKSTDSSAGSVETPAVQPPSMSVLDLFRSPTLRWKTSIILYQWFVCAMVYYGLGLNATRLGSSVYVNFILVQIIEVPAAFCCILLLDPWGRKLILSLSFVLGGLGSIASGVVSGLEDMQTLTVALAMVGKFGASATFAIVFVYGAELFPTDLRNSGIGISSAAGRIGSILAPFIASLAQGSKSQVLPMSIFGVLCLIGAAVTLYLPETFGQKLPDTIEESENFGRDQTLCHIPWLVRRKRRKLYA
ncbi:organic cation transporter protein-like isoform X2 [Pollicipes pollicipes]|uniref:organic cation transporter protein-like isoform X2 n=1 Tax=Pollicipes pollicipes TaxID=41117 RepID=UPI00188582CB|nr:organic cation transporter protein-like isoform X2 [Pollicipes pollicipes]